MCQFLPLKGFQWLTREEMDDMLTNTKKISSCTLEVDLDVPDDVEYHKSFNDYLLAPKKQTMNYPLAPKKQTIPNFFNKKN